MRPRRPSRAQVQREQQLLIRTFPVEYVEIFRNVPTQGSLGQKGPPTKTIVYQGEALVMPSGGSVAIEGLGQIEFNQPYVIIASSRDIQQGDYMRHKNRQLQVEFPPDYWKAFMILRMIQNQQAVA